MNGELLQPVLVIGASGFIGQGIAEQLNLRKADWFSVDIKPTCEQLPAERHFICDIRQFDDLRKVFQKINPKTVLVVAARTDISDDRVNDYETNIDGTINVIKAINASETVSRVIFTSSQLVRAVGDISKNKWAYRPDSTYGDSKVLNEKFVKLVINNDVCWTIVRPTTVWGPRCSEHYASLLKFIKAGIYFHSGGSDHAKSFGYVGNIGYQYLRLAEAETSLVNRSIFYLADYTPIGIKSFCNKIGRRLNARVIPTVPLWLCKCLARVGDLLGCLKVTAPFNSFRLNNITTEYVFDLSDTEKVCGPLPYSLDDGIDELVKWYERKF